MTYEDALATLGATTGASLAALWAASDADGPEWDEQFVEIASVVLAAANTKAAHMGVLSAAASVAAATGTPLRITAGPDTSHRTDVVRLRSALETIVRNARDDEDDPDVALRRIGRTEPASSAAYAVQESLRADERVSGWRRAVNGSACVMCRGWAANGRVFPIDRPMKRHTGCSCTQDPVIGERTPDRRSRITRIR